MAVATVAFAASAPGQSFLISVFVDDMLAGTGLDRTTFSGLYAGGTVVSALWMLVLGKVMDRHGLRVGWVAVTIGLAAACGLASVATGVVSAFVALALLRLCGQGSFPLLGTLLIARSFDRRRGQAMAVGHLGLTAASVVLPPVVAALIVGVGWRHAYQVLGLVLIVAVLPVAVLVRTGPPRVTSGTVATATDADFPAAVRSVLNGRLTLPTRPAALMLLVVTTPPLVVTALTFHAVSILGEKQLSLLQAGFALSVLGGASVVGTVGVGLFADKVGNRALLGVISIAALAAPLTLLAPAAVTAYTAFGILGLAAGTGGVVNGMVWARTYGTAQLGRIQGTAQSAMITAAAVAPLVPAISHGLTGSYDASLLLLAAYGALSVVVATRWRPSPPPGRPTTAGSG